MRFPGFTGPHRSLFQTLEFSWGFHGNVSRLYQKIFDWWQDFVYLFAPLRHLLKEADLQNFRLENGLKIWPALWDYRHPNALCFTAPVRPKKCTSAKIRSAVLPSACQLTGAHLNIAAPVLPASVPVLPANKDVLHNDVFIGNFCVLPVVDPPLGFWSWKIPHRVGVIWWHQLERTRSVLDQSWCHQ